MNGSALIEVTLELLHPLAEEAALRLREVLHEDDPLQMIDLVLQHGGEAILRGHLMDLAFAILVADPDAPEALDLLELVRHRQPTLLQHHRLGPLEDLRIDDLEEGAVLPP